MPEQDDVPQTDELEGVLEEERRSHSRIEASLKMASESQSRPKAADEVVAPASGAQVIGMAVLASLGGVLGVAALAVAFLNGTVKAFLNGTVINAAALAWVVCGAASGMLAVRAGWVALSLQRRRRVFLTEALILAMEFEEGNRVRSIHYVRQQRDALTASGDLQIAERLHGVLRRLADKRGRTSTNEPESDE